MTSRAADQLRSAPVRDSNTSTGQQPVVGERVSERVGRAQAVVATALDHGADRVELRADGVEMVATKAPAASAAAPFPPVGPP